MFGLKSEYCLSAIFVFKLLKIFRNIIYCKISIMTLQNVCVLSNFFKENPYNLFKNKNRELWRHGIIIRSSFCCNSFLFSIAKTKNMYLHYKKCLTYGNFCINFLKVEIVFSSRKMKQIVNVVNVIL